MIVNKKGDGYLYTAQTTIDRVQKQIKSKDLIQKAVLEKCGINENTLKKMTDNKGISSFSLAKISDELDCSVDYLLGRTENPQSHKSIAITTGDIKDNNNSVIGNGNSDIYITGSIDTITADLLKVFEKLDSFKKAKLLLYAEELSKIE